MERIEQKERLPGAEIIMATEGDAAAIVDVQRETWIATYPNEELGITREDILNKDWDNARRIEQWSDLAREANATNRLWVAKTDGKVIGFCAATKTATENRLTAIYVLPLYQGKGLGTKLMQQFLSWADGEKTSTVEVANYNSDAIEFYQRSGFSGNEPVPMGERPDLPSGKYIPEIRMRRQPLQPDL